MSELFLRTADIADDEPLTRAVENYTLDALNDCAKQQSIRVVFSVQRLEDELLVRGTVSGSIVLQCCRCLENASWEFALPFDQAFPVAQETIDIGPEVRDAVLLNLPQKPLCGDTCRGLCPICGGNRNVAACDCAVQVPDPRLAKLKNLL